jgi:hypothetical protein
MVIENTEANRRIQAVAATMAIEDMYLSKDLVEELIKVGKGEKTTEDIRQEAYKRYARH